MTRAGFGGGGGGVGCNRKKYVLLAHCVERYICFHVTLGPDASELATDSIVYFVVNTTQASAYFGELGQCS